MFGSACCEACEGAENGEGFTESIKGVADAVTKYPKQIYDAFSGGRSGAPPDVRRFLEKYGDSKIGSAIVCRKPVQSTLKSVINAVTFGGLNKAMKKLHYDDIFHLYMYFDIITSSGERSTWRVEKNQVLSLKRSSRDVATLGPGGDCKPVAFGGRGVTPNKLFVDAEKKRGSMLYTYDAVKANCQDFILSLLEPQGLLTPELNQFIKQDAESLVPKYMRSPSRALTDIAARADVALRGKGIDSYADDPPPDHRRSRF